MKRGHRSNPDDSVFGQAFGQPFDSTDDGLIERPVDRMVHEVLDAEARGDQAAARAWFRAAVAVDPAAAQRLRELRRVLTQARKAPPAPDLSAAILASVDAQQPFVTGRRRRQISATRIAVAASFVVTGALIGLVHWSGGSASGSGNAAPAPMATGSGSAGESAMRVAQATEPPGAASSTVRPAPRLSANGTVQPLAAAPARPPLTLGDISRYDARAGFHPPEPWTTDDFFSPRRVAAADGGAEFDMGVHQRPLLSREPAGLTLTPTAPAATMMPAWPFSEGLPGLVTPDALLLRRLLELEPRLEPRVQPQR